MKIDTKYKIKIIGYFFEVIFARLRNFLHLYKDSSVIPIGHYCYVDDEEKNKTRLANEGYWIKPCMIKLIVNVQNVEIRFIYSVKNVIHVGMTQQNKINQK